MDVKKQLENSVEAILLVRALGAGSPLKKMTVAGLAASVGFTLGHLEARKLIDHEKACCLLATCHKLRDARGASLLARGLGWDVEIEEG